VLVGLVCLEGLVDLEVSLGLIGLVGSVGSV
jgi:hypothetical protein